MFQGRSLDQFESVHPLVSAANIPEGEYLFKVTITDTTDERGPWIYSDILSTEPNRETTLGTDTTPFDLPKLIGEAPAKPDRFTVYWKDDGSEEDANDLSYTATFAWDRISFNELSFKLEIADITEYYNPINGNYDGTGAAGITVLTNEDLWREIVAQTPTAITELTKDDFSSSENYPIIYGGEGSLLAGSTSIKYKLPAGRLFAARLRATNADGESEVAYAGDTNGTAPGSKPNDPIEEIINDDDPDVLVFNVFAITYDLQGKFILIKDQQLPTADYPNVVKGKDVKFKTYRSQNPKDIDYKIYDQNNDGYRLLSASNTPQEANDNTNNTYAGFTNVVLITDASGSGNGTVDVESTGTYSNLLTGDTLLIGSGDADTPQTELGDGDKFDAKTINGTNDVSIAGQGGALATGSLGKADNTPAVNMPINATNHATAYHLYFAIGGEIDGTFTVDKLPADPALDQSPRTATVKTATYTLETSSGTIVKTVTSPDNTSVASMEITGVPSGNYVLRAEARFTSGWESTFQTPFILKYSDEAVTTAAP